MAQQFDGRLDEALKAQLAKAGIAYGLSIGRRAPLHKMHLDCILEIAAAGLTPVVVIGSSNAAGDPLYDPLKNPLTVEEQLVQLKAALPPGLYEKCLVLTLPDRLEDADWMQSLKGLLQDHDLAGRTVMHFRAKAADAAAPADGRARPLSQYRQDLMAMGLSVWQSYNGDAADDLINASDLRGLDVERIPADRQAQFAALNTYADAVRRARLQNPDGALLEAAGVPKTALDLTLTRLAREAGVATAELLEKAKTAGSVSHAALLSAAKDKIDQLKRKPMILIGPRMSRAAAEGYARDTRFDILPASVGSFQSGETFSELFYGDGENFEKNAARLKGADVFVVQPTAAPVGDNVQHLLHMIHTLKYYGAAQVTAVLPFAAYARQDRAFAQRFASVGADMLPKQLQAAGADAVVGVTLHSKAAMDFYKAAFGEKFTNVSTAALFAAHLKNTGGDLVFGAPDGGEKLHDEGIARAADVARAFNSAAMFKISKVHTAANDTKVVAFDGDVRGKTAVLVDDMVDGGSTLANAARVLRQNGAKEVICCVTHAVLTPGEKNLRTGEVPQALRKVLLEQGTGELLVDRLILTDSIPDVYAKREEFAKMYPAFAGRVEILPLAPFLMDAMQPAPKVAAVKRAGPG